MTGPRESKLRSKILAAVGAERAAAMESESRAWVMTCPTCTTTQSIWDLGGIRYTAKSAGLRKRVRCLHCGQRYSARISRVDDAP